MRGIGSMWVVGCVVTAILLTGLCSSQLLAQSNDDAKKMNDEARRSTETTNNDIIFVTEQLAKSEKAGGQSGPSGGPPAKQNLLNDEARQRLEWMKNIRDQQQDLLRQAAHARNPAEAWVLANAARKLGSTSSALKESIVGEPAPAPQANSGGGAPAPSGRSGGIQLGRSGALEQAKSWNETLHSIGTSNRIDGAMDRARTSFGQGRAGAGGVALYRAATITGPFDRSKVGSAWVDNDRLVLSYGGQKVRFPQFDPQFLALAIRSVYGGEGLVKGTLLANEANAVVLRTGAEQFGDVVWKKEFLPGLPADLKVGQELALDLGPGVGVLSIPEPSYGRVTYYGPLKGNVLGQVLQESDMVFSMFWNGVDWKTGRVLDPSKLPGYESAIDIDLREPPAQPTSTARSEPAKNWWEETSWFVWTPGEMVLQFSPPTGELEFVKAEMKVTVWSVRESNVGARSLAQGRYLTQHYDDFTRAFPILARLRDAAKVVAVVRWLKQNNVNLDLSWAGNYRLAKVDTPDTYRRFSVYIWKDKTGLPTVMSENPR